ncbi:virulence factor TspB C-terminal domain-related protein [Aeromonas media]|uniref:virulence factor TspB C-terminal domain-related protein n=1 Tax=Aeromonas media TaxID=651 RepID=UPI003D1B4F05
MRLFLFLLFLCPSAFAAYTEMVIEGVKQSNGVWTTAGVMDTAGFVRTTGAVTVAGSTSTFPVALAADVPAATTLMKASARLAGPLALAAAAYDVYEWVNSDPDISTRNNEWIADDSFVDAYGYYWGVGSTCISSNAYDVAHCVDANDTAYKDPVCTKVATNQYNCTLTHNTVTTTKKTFSVNRYSCSNQQVQSCMPSVPLTWEQFDSFLPSSAPIPILISAWTKLPSLSGQPTPIKGVDFTPTSVWASDPYFKDGNWWRDRVDISPAPLPGQPTRVRIDYGPVKLDGQTDPTVKPDDTPATGNTQPKEQTKFCDDNPQSIACAELGELEDEELETQERPFQITPKSPWGADNANCPAPKIISLSSGGVVEITYQPTCDFLAGVRPAVLALTFLAALYIALGIPVGKGD